jgi:L-ascorbate metabolism protein UlaG (beta-lactamase superfamily)
MRRRVTWCGHATVLFDLGGTRLLTDPLLRGRMGHLRRHARNLHLPQQLDAVLISHLHMDHADCPTLREIDPSVPVYGPPGLAKLLSDRTVHEVTAGDTFTVGALAVEAVHAEHEVRRLRWGAVSPALGFVLDKIYFAGDTDIFDGMAELGPLDLALLPVWGWGPSLGPGHLDPGGAAEALTRLRPRVAVPIHWGTYLPVGIGRRHGELLERPPVDFAAFAARLAPDVRVVVLGVGESLEV